MQGRFNNEDPYIKVRKAIVQDYIATGDVLERVRNGTFIRDVGKTLDELSLDDINFNNLNNMNNKYNINDDIYHVTPNSPKGVILDIVYYYKTKYLEYTVAWSHNETSFCSEDELSKTPKFV